MARTRINAAFFDTDLPRLTLFIINFSVSSVFSVAKTSVAKPLFV